MKQIGQRKPASWPSDRRTAERRVVAIPARLGWKTQRGVTRFASVVTRDVSESGVFIECQSSLWLPLYRLVQFQVEPSARLLHELPETLRKGTILSAVYRVSHATRTGSYGIALRLIVDPRHRHAEQTEAARASA